MARITKSNVIKWPSQPRVPLLTGDQQRAVRGMLANPLRVAPLPAVAAELGLDERTAETALRFSGFLVQHGQVK